MAGRDDDLELSLRMGLGRVQNNNHHASPSPLELSLAHDNVFSQRRSKGKSSNDLFLASSSLAERNAETRSFLGAIDVNQAPPSSAADMDDDYWISSPNSTVSSAISAGKRAEREAAVENENEGERTSCSRGSDDEDGGAGDGDGRKKLRLTREQALVLEETFKEHNTLNPKQKLALAGQLNLRPRQVEVWFQNRRARTKLKQTEVDCEYLKKCCENLTQENRRLNKEVQELRALKLSSHLYMHMTPPTTLTMCPSCERVSSSAAMSRQPHVAPEQLQHHPGNAAPEPVNPWVALQMGSQHQPFNPQPSF